jgi:hypothetical protein
MVYSEFVVSTRPQFGDYSACNPDPKTGIFKCEHYSQPTNRTTPKQCKSGFEMYHHDCLNGTIYKYLPYADEGACCAACTADAGKCDGWNMPDASSHGCQLLTSPLFQWDDGQEEGKCIAAQRAPGYTPGSDCWYDDHYFNATFSGVCDRKICVCDAIENYAMGRELGAMCRHHSNSSSSRRRASAAATAPLHTIPEHVQLSTTTTATAATTTTAAAASAASATATAITGAKGADFSNYWACNAAIYDACFDTIGVAATADKVSRLWSSLV